LLVAAAATGVLSRCSFFVRLRPHGASALLLKLLNLLGLRHQVGGKPFKLVRGSQMWACSRKPGTHEGALAKIFDDFRNHECVLASEDNTEVKTRNVMAPVTNRALFILVADETLATFRQIFAL
jgi:hypothetical protein